MTTRPGPFPTPLPAPDAGSMRVHAGEGRRARRRRRARVGSVVGAAVVALLACGLSGGWGGASGSAASATERPGAAPSAHLASTGAVVKMLSCSGKTVYKPASFVVTCADGYTMLTQTHWTTWTAAEATGTTRFGLNLCDPYCAASKMSFFPDSKVQLWRPVDTKHGRLFSELRVVYTLHGKTKVLPFSWLGDPSFRK